MKPQRNNAGVPLMSSATSHLAEPTQGDRYRSEEGYQEDGGKDESARAPASASNATDGS
jgi:hypothetical protein